MADRKIITTRGDSGVSPQNVTINVGFETGRTITYDSVDTPASRVPLPAGVLKSIEGFVIIVEGVHQEASEDDLLVAFEEYGEVKQIDLSLNRKTGYTNGYALIKYDNVRSAENAIKGLHLSEILGETIQVGWAFTNH